MFRKAAMSLADFTLVLNTWSAFPLLCGDTSFWNIIWKNKNKNFSVSPFHNMIIGIFLINEIKFPLYLLNAFIKHFVKNKR